MKAFAQHPSVSLGCAHNHTDLVIRKSREFRLQLRSMPQQQAVSRFEASRDLACVVERIDFLAIHRRTIRRAGHGDALANEAHAIRAGILPTRNSLRGQLPGGAPQSADVRAIAGIIGKKIDRQQADTQRRVAEIRRGDFAGLLRLQFVEPRMEERLQINQYRVFTGGDQIFAVKIGCLQGIENRQIAALTLIEAPDFLRSCRKDARWTNSTQP